MNVVISFIRISLDSISTILIFIIISSSSTILSMIIDS